MAQYVRLGRVTPVEPVPRNSALHNPNFKIHTPHSTIRTPQSTLHNPFSTLHNSSSEYCRAQTIDTAVDSMIVQWWLGQNSWVFFQWFKLLYSTTCVVHFLNINNFVSTPVTFISVTFKHFNICPTQYSSLVYKVCILREI